MVHVEKVLAAIQAEMNNVSRRTLEIPKATHSDYMKECGIFQGLQMAENIIKKSVKETL